MAQPKKKWWQPDLRWWEWPIGLIWTVLWVGGVGLWARCGVPLVVDLHPGVNAYSGLVEAPDLQDRKDIEEFSATYIEAGPVTRGGLLGRLRHPAYIEVHLRYRSRHGDTRTREWVYFRTAWAEGLEGRNLRSLPIKEVAWMQVFRRGKWVEQEKRYQYVPLESVRVQGHHPEPPKRPEKPESQKPTRGIAIT